MWGQEYGIITSMSGADYGSSYRVYKMHKNWQELAENRLQEKNDLESKASRRDIEMPKDSPWAGICSIFDLAGGINQRLAALQSMVPRGNFLAEEIQQ